MAIHQAPRLHTATMRAIVLNDRKNLLLASASVEKHKPADKETITRQFWRGGSRVMRRAQPSPRLCPSETSAHEHPFNTPTSKEGSPRSCACKRLPKPQFCEAWQKMEGVGDLHVFRDIIKLACRKFLQFCLRLRHGFVKEGVFELAHLAEEILLGGVDEGFHQQLVSVALGVSGSQI